MARELHDLLTEGVPSDPGTPDLDAIERRSLRRRAGRAGGVTLALVAALTLGVQALPERIDAPIVEQPEDSAPAELPTGPPTDEQEGPGTAAGSLDITQLPALGDAGLAIQTSAGVELVALDGTSLGVLEGYELALGEMPDHGLSGGPLLLWSPDWVRGAWVDPTTGDVLPAQGMVPMLAGAALVEDGTKGWQLLGDAYDGPQPAVSARVTPHVGMSGALLTTATCNERPKTCEGPQLIDLDIGGVGAVTQGCVATDKLGDFGAVMVCNTTDGSSWLEVPNDEATGAARIDVERTAVTEARFNGAVLGDTGLVAQLGRSCDHPVAVTFEDGSTRSVFGGRWSDQRFASALLGRTSAFGGRTPIVHVPARSECAVTPTVTPGVYAIEPDGPRLLNELDGRMVLWGSSGIDLAASAETVIEQYEPTGTDFTTGDHEVLLHVTDVRDGRVAAREATAAAPLVRELELALESGWPFGFEGYEGSDAFGPILDLPIAPDVRIEWTPDWETWQTTDQSGWEELQSQLGSDTVSFDVHVERGVIVSMRHRLES